MDGLKVFPNFDSGKSYLRVAPRKVNFDLSFRLPALILRIGRKIGNLEPREDAHAEADGVSAVYHNTLEPSPRLWRRRSRECESAKSVNGALPNLLAPSVRIHLSEGFLRSGRARSNSGFLHDAA